MTDAVSFFYHCYCSMQENYYYFFRSGVMDDLTLSCLANQCSVVQTTSSFLTSVFKNKKVAGKRFFKRIFKGKAGHKEI